MFNIGGLEFFFILFVILLVIQPEKIPKFIEYIKKYITYLNNIKKSFQKNLKNLKLNKKFTKNKQLTKLFTKKWINSFLKKMKVNL